MTSSPSRIRASAVAVVVLLTASCTPGAREATPFQGNWQSATWGTYMSVSGGTVEVYEYSDLHCIRVARSGARGIEDALSLADDELILEDSGRTIRFSPVEFLPERCGAEPSLDSPSLLAAAAATVAAHYAPGVDEEWETRTARLIEEVGPGDEELLRGISELLSPLGGRGLRVASSGRDPWSPVSEPDVDLLEGETSGDGGIVSATLAGDVAYVGLRRFGAFAGDPSESARRLGAVIDAAAATRAIILDLRLADGGGLEHAQVVASRFVQQDALLARFEARGPGGFESAGDAGVVPLPAGTFDGPVAVVIGPGTTGPAELLAHVLGLRDDVWIVGVESGGAPAPRMVRHLPNGWVLGLPNLRSFDSDGVELGSVVPDVVTAEPVAVALRLLADG